jgi:hypothetical protein
MNVSRFRLSGLAVLLLTGVCALPVAGCSSSSPVGQHEVGAPTANAGISRDVKVAQEIKLDGSASAAASAADKLTYEWVIKDAPKGSASTLTAQDQAYPTITPDLVGSYVIGLVVTANGIPSHEAEVTLRATKDNIAPEAKVVAPAAEQRITRRFTLDGSQSSDADNDPITYQWSVVKAPGGSVAQIFDDRAKVASFAADVEGDYILGLTVNDGHVNSTVSNVTFTAKNIPVAAVKASVRAIDVGGSITLDGSASTPSYPNTTFTYAWALASAPPGSKVALTDDQKTAANLSLALDVEGDFVFSLTTAEGKLLSDPHYVTIKSGRPEAIIKMKTSSHIGIGKPIKLDATGSAAPNPAATLTYTWVILSKPDTSKLALPAAPAAPAVEDHLALIPDVAGDYTIGLTVNDGTLSSTDPSKPGPNDQSTVTVTVW